LARKNDSKNGKLFGATAGFLGGIAFGGLMLIIVDKLLLISYP
jgi:hypothetical protein